MNRTLNAEEMTEIEIVINQLYAERGITTDVNSLYEKSGGKVDNNKYVVGRIPKKMPTLTDYNGTRKLDKKFANLIRSDIIEI